MALVATLIMSTSAQAAAPAFVDSFTCSPSTPCGGATSWKPLRLAVNEETGDVYVIDTLNEAIQVFDSEGAYESSILDSSTSPGSQAFGFYAESDIAIDNSGTSTQGRIYVNDATTFFGLTAAGAPAWEEGGFGSEDPCGVAVDDSGSFYAVVYSTGAQKMNPATGAPEGSPIAASGESCNAAFDSQDRLFVREWGFGNIVRFDPPTYSTPGTTLDPGQHNLDLEVDRADDEVFMTDSIQDKVVVYSAAGGEVAGTPFESGAAGNNYVGVTVNAEARLIYVSDDANDTVEIFAPPNHALNIFTSGGGSGSVSCDGGACAASYPDGTEVTLAVSPDPHNSFEGWSVTGDPSTTCTGTTSSCKVTLEGEVFVEAAFEPILHQLSILKTGAGQVTSAPAGISCGITCAADFQEGSTILLTATPAAGNHLEAWGGCEAEPSGKCEVSLDADTEVTATFVANDGDGDGVPDTGDACPTQSGSQPNGCPPPPPDSDGDGVPDTGDACPNQAAATPNGCPAITLPPPPPPPNLYGQCVARAEKAFGKARKAALKKKGAARARALKRAKRGKRAAVARCKALYR